MIVDLMEFIVDNVRRLLSLWADSRLENAIGANFLYVMLSVWLVWLMVNIFLIRPLPGGGLFGTNRVRVSSRSSGRSSSNGDASADGVSESKGDE